MKERPILFSAPMVRAILAGTKTQTRRAVKPQPDSEQNGEPYWWVGGFRVREWARNPLRCPYGQPGDRLWVRETWRRAYRPGYGSSGVIYRADALRALGMDEYSGRHAWHPSIHMPRAASRITLEITGVRVEMLGDITEQDASAEGVSSVAAFVDLWKLINHSWEPRTWVWALQFQRV